MLAPERSLSILIVDDEEDNRVILKELLGHLSGWKLELGEAGSADAAVAAMRERIFDVVFLDYRLPDLDGIKLLEQIRQLHPKAAVVMMSALGNEKVAVNAMKRGAIDYLVHDDLRSADLGQLLRRAMEMQLLQSENLELRQVNRMKDEFISSVSHELRTPLAVILGYARALEDGDLGDVTEPQKKALDSLRNRGERMLQMVNRLLAFKETAYNTQEVLLRATEIGSYLNDFLDGRWPSGGKRKIKIEREIPGDPLWVLADPEQLRDVFDNLMSNAVKFSPESSTVSIFLKIHSGREAWVRIKDEGRGIPPESLPRLFDSFYHTDSELTRDMGGLGIGLALTRQIIEMHGGRIWLDSEGEGKGTMATVALPLSEPDTPHIIVEHQKRAEKRRVLVCEDNADIVEIIRIFLSSFSDNLELTTTFTGREAVELVSQRRFDLLVLDMMLPDMSGLEVLERVQRAPEGKRPPVMILSGHQEAAKQAVRKGAQEYMMKPFTKQAFLDKVLGFIGLDRRKGQRKPE
jgi:signal transduction histidine kinase